MKRPRFKRPELFIVQNLDHLDFELRYIIKINQKVFVIYMPYKSKKFLQEQFT